jgi:hypothetical protein
LKLPTGALMDNFKVAIMQPYFFPYIGYWQLINSVDTFVLFDDVNYIKKGYINRNSILLNNAPHKITLEINQASQNKKINELMIGNNRLKLIKTIEMAYKKAPFFDEVFQLIESILKNNEDRLELYLLDMIKDVSAHLEIKTKFIQSSQLSNNKLLKSEDKIIDIASLLNATHYVNAIGGQELYDKEKFNSSHLELNFIRNKGLDYNQYDKNSFSPNLSIIDVLMFNSKQDINKMLNNFELI